MDKDKILLKARREGMLGIDEGTKLMKDHGRLIGQGISSLVFLILALLAFLSGNEIDCGVQAMFLGYLAGESFLAWRLKKSKRFLLLSISAGFLTVLNLIEAGCRMFGAAL